MTQTAPDDLPTLPPPGRLIATADIISLADRAAKRTARLGAAIASLEAGIAKRGEDAAASAAAAGFPPEDQRAAARKVAQKGRAELSVSSEDTRWGYIKDVNAAAESAALTAALFASPQAVLARAGLGSAERSHYLQQLDGSGVVELRNMAALAVATNNKTLGAAIMSVVDRMPRRERPISSAELADRLVGEETRAVQDAVTRIKLAAQQAINLNREFTAGRVRPLDRVKLALNKREA
jgi:hypothetical protein